MAKTCQIYARNSVFTPYTEPAATLGWYRRKLLIKNIMSTETDTLDHFIGYEVVDDHNDKLGTLGCIWADDRGEPTFLGVKTGWFMGKHHVVPAEAASVNEREHRIRLPMPEDIVKEAPTVNPDFNVDEDTQQKIYNYYEEHGIHFTGERARFPIEGSSMDVPPKMERPTEMASMETSSTDERRIPLREEELKVGKREVESGGVRLRKVVHTEMVNQPVELRKEGIVIERVPASESQAEASSPSAFKEEDIYIPLRHEEAVVEKQQRVTEEVRVGKTSETERRDIQAEVRKEELRREDQGTDDLRGDLPRS